MSREQKKRRRRFVDRQVQGALIVQIMRHWLLFFFGMFVILTYLQVMFSGETRTCMEHVRITLNEHAPVYFVALFMLPLFIKDIVNLSHRFVGPVLHVRRELRRLANGEPVTPIKLRDNDYWHGLAEDFNAMLASMDHEQSNLSVTPSDEGEQPAHPEERQLVDCEV